MADELLNHLPRKEHGRFLKLLQVMLAIPALEIKSTLDQAGQLVGEAFQADKVDVLLYAAATQTLVAVGTTDTPMAQRERQIGLNRLPL